MALRPKITMRSLNNQGRWGNCLFEYMFVRTYARVHGADYEVSPWLGEAVFGRPDPRVTAQLPDRHERNQAGCYSPTLPPEGREYLDHNFVGYGQLHTSWFREHKRFVQGLFKLAPDFNRRL